MAIGDVTLTSAMRANLLNLQSVADLQDRTQLRLSTGKSVNSVVDDPVKFFQSSALQTRANLFDGLKANIGNALKTIDSAANGIKAIKASIEQLRSIKTQANDLVGKTDAASVASRATLATRYNETISQIQNLVDDASFNGVNFLKKDTSLTVNFNEDATTKLVMSGFDASAQGLNLTKGFNPTVVGGSSATQSVTFGSSDSITKTTDGVSTVVLGGITVGMSATGVLTVNDADNVYDVSVAANTALPTVSFNTADGVLTVAKTSDNLLTVQYSDDGTYGEAGDIQYVTSGGVGTSAVGTVTVEAGTTDDAYVMATANGATMSGTGYTKATTATGSTAQASFFATANYTATDLDSSTELAALESKVNAALIKLEAESGTLGGNVSILTTRETFLKEMITTLSTGASNLVKADVNEEAANLLALQTSQQLGTTALSLASQALQSVLRLF